MKNKSKKEILKIALIAAVLVLTLALTPGCFDSSDSDNSSGSGEPPGPAKWGEACWGECNWNK